MVAIEGFRVLVFRGSGYGLLRSGFLILWSGGVGLGFRVEGSRLT